MLLWMLVVAHQDKIYAFVLSVAVAMSLLSGSDIAVISTAIAGSVGVMFSAAANARGKQNDLESVRRANEFIRVREERDRLDEEVEELRADCEILRNRVYELQLQNAKKELGIIRLIGQLETNNLTPVWRPEQVAKKS